MQRHRSESHWPAILAEVGFQNRFPDTKTSPSELALRNTQLIPTDDPCEAADELLAGIKEIRIQTIAVEDGTSTNRILDGWVVTYTALIRNQAYRCVADSLVRNGETETDMRPSITNRDRCLKRRIVISGIKWSQETQAYMATKTQ